MNQIPPFRFKEMKRLEIIRNLPDEMHRLRLPGILRWKRALQILVDEIGNEPRDRYQKLPEEDSEFRTTLSRPCKRIAPRNRSNGIKLNEIVCWVGNHVYIYNILECKERRFNMSLDT